MKVLVIGADQGLGKVLVRKLKENGYTTVAGLFSMKNKPEQEEGVLYLPMDVTNEEQLQTSAERMEETVGKINCVVSVAGILPPEDRTCTLMTEPIEVIRKQQGYDTLQYNRLEDMLESVGIPVENLCTYCWDGKEE